MVCNLALQFFFQENLFHCKKTYISLEHQTLNRAVDSDIRIFEIFEIFEIFTEITVDNQTV